MADKKAQLAAMEFTVHGCEECEMVQMRFKYIARGIDFTTRLAFEVAEMLMEAAHEADPSIPDPNNPS